MAKIHAHVFKLRKRLIISVSGSIFCKTIIRIRPGYHRFGVVTQSPVMKLLKWGRKIKEGAMSLFTRSSYVRLGSEMESRVPKGHMVVYVGQKEEEKNRVLVPVMYFNHPLFGELLREAEKENGFNHKGGITIPCRFTEFEQVKTWIASESSNCTGRKLNLKICR